MIPETRPNTNPITWLDNSYAQKPGRHLTHYNQIAALFARQALHFLTAVYNPYANIMKQPKREAKELSSDCFLMAEWMTTQATPRTGSVHGPQP